MIKKLIAIAMAAALPACAFSACSSGNDNPSASSQQSKASGTVQPQKAVQSTDNYRNFYQIFVYSFCDSNGDDVGDIPGIVSKLDYLNDGDPEKGDDLGIDGIWLTPIAKSVSYHKYSVEDYCSIDEEFGTMEDFEKLIAECKKRGINVITDLVVNHSSNRHEWFVKACEEINQGNPDGYAKYYHIVKEDDKTTGDKYYPIQGTDYYYEANFSDTMPELNLSNPDVRAEIKKIMKFWLDKGVAGFRLDAIKYYDTGGDDGKDFCKWITDTAHELKKDSYIIGENYSGTGQISDWYSTGIDSQFNFPMSSAIGDYVNTTRTGNVKKLYSTMQSWQKNIRSKNKNAIDSPFLSNHDMARSAAYLVGNLESEKLAAMLYMLSPGTPYIYYGEELGLLGSDKDNDGTYRLPMPWEGDEWDKILIPNTSVESAEDYIVTTVKDAQKDENSLFKTYQQLIKLKLQNPEIARGTITKVIETGENYAAGYVIEYDGKKVVIFCNADKTESFSGEISKSDCGYSGIAGQVTARSAGDSEQAKLEGSTLTVPPMTAVILR